MFCCYTKIKYPRIEFLEGILHLAVLALQEVTWVFKNAAAWKVSVTGLFMPYHVSPNGVSSHSKFIPPYFLLLHFIFEAFEE